MSDSPPSGDVLRGLVLQYNITRCFGIAEADGRSHLFLGHHFQRLVPGGPFPILGEPLDLRFRTRRVYLASRVEEPDLLRGEVVRYSREYGFIRPDGWSEDLYFHTSGFLEPLAPVAGLRVEFYVGYPGRDRQRARACWVARERHT